MFELLIKLIGSIKDFSDIFCYIIVAVALGSFIGLHYKWLTLYKNIKSLTKRFQDKEVNGEIDINKIFEYKNHVNNKYLQYLWDKYCKAIENNNYNPIDSSLYFNRTTIIELPMKRRIAEAVPGILTGLGILGTFIGLVSGLSYIDISNSERIRESITPLLSGLATAFTTSVVGVFSSLVWALLDKILLKIYIKELAEFVDSFRRAFPIPYDSEYLREIIKLQEDQSETIKHLSTDIAQTLTRAMKEEFAPAITASIDKSLKETISPAIDGLREIVKTFAEKASERQNEGLQNIVNEFIQNMNKSLHGQFDALAKAIEEMVEWQMLMKSDLDELIKKIKETTQNQILINDNAEDVIKNIKEHISDLYEANNSLVENLKVIENLNSLITDKTKENYEILSEIDREKEEINKRYANMSSIAKEQIERINDIWNGTKENLDELNNQLSLSMKEFSKDTNDKLVRTFDVFDKELTSIANHLSSTIYQINETIDELPRVISLFKDKFEEGYESNKAVNE